MIQGSGIDGRAAFARPLLFSAALATLTFAAFEPLQARAQTSPQPLHSPQPPQPALPLPAVVVTPSRLAQSIDDALPATSVITRADIERWQAVDLVSVLSRATGVEFAQVGGRGAQASLFVRGANSAQVLVLVDGVRLNSVNGGAAAVGGIALDTVERIEVARGNLSSLYGSAAIGGVVQIFTRTGAPGFTAVIEGGQGNTLNGSLIAAGVVDRLTVGGTVAGAKTKAFSAINPRYGVAAGSPPIANPDEDANRSASASFSARYRGTDDTVASLSAWANRNTTDFDSAFDAADVTHSEQSRLGGINASVRTTPSVDWETQFTLGATRDRTENSVSDPQSFSNGNFESSNLQIGWTNEIRLGEQVQALTGLEYLKQKGESTSYDPSFSGASTEFERSVGSAWGGLVGRFGPHQWQANVRYDDYSDVGGATSGLLGYGYLLAPDWRVTAQVSNAFRAPSFNDLYFPFFGNPKLKPEKSASGEIGLQYTASALSFRAALYRTDTRDLIVYDPATSQAQNLDNARVTGFELGGGWRSGGWNLSANGTLLRAVDEATDERLPRRAPWLVNAAIAYEAERWNAGLEISVVGPRDDFDLLSFQRIELASYTLARLVGGWRVSSQILLRARVENLFDANYETVSGYNVMPRTVIVGVELRY